jgi:long-chain acyl-CoA synthetase
VAYVVAAQGRAVDGEEIIGFCRQHLAAYKVPRAVKVVADLPKTSTGKIMRRELKNLPG